MWDVLSSAHSAAAWLVTIVGGLCVGMLLVSLLRPSAAPYSRLALWVFGGLVTLQVLLGVSAAVVAEPGVAFADDQDKFLWHAVLGGSSLLLVALAVWSARLPQRRVLTTLLAAGALVAPNIGRLGLVLLATVVGVVVGALTSGRASAPNRP